MLRAAFASLLYSGQATDSRMIIDGIVSILGIVLPFILKYRRYSKYSARRMRRSRRHRRERISVSSIGSSK
jgi:predicted histidine transporter YuiF (NhaC family)